MHKSIALHLTAYTYMQQHCILGVATLADQLTDCEGWLVCLQVVRFVAAWHTTTGF
jgi:hypothetical protein